jgi:hypothetical protein
MGEKWGGRDYHGEQFASFWISGSPSNFPLSAFTTHLASNQSTI